MEIVKQEVYRSCNIGVFLKCNEKVLLVPNGLAETKVETLSASVHVPYVYTSVNGLRVIGPLVSMNSNGILVSKFIEDYELKSLREETGLNVERFPSTFTAIGNLLAANDHGAIASNLLSTGQVNFIRDVLDVPVERMSIAGYIYTGSMIFSTNVGTLVPPLTSEREIKEVEAILKTNIVPCTINGGVPIISSGIVGNSKGLVVGSLTGGNEIMNISMSFE